MSDDMQYMASTKRTLRKSTVLAFLYCFEKSLESFEFWQETFTTAIHTNFPAKCHFARNSGLLASGI